LRERSRPFLSVPNPSPRRRQRRLDGAGHVHGQDRAYETPFYSTLSLRFDGDRLMLDSEHNVAFGPTKLPPLVGQRGKPGPVVGESPGHSATSGMAAADGAIVSVIRTAAIRPDANVSAATSHIAAGRPSASA